MNLDAHFWRTLLLSLAMGSAVMFVLASTLHWICRRAESRKSIWQAGLVGLALLLSLELFGVGGGMILHLMTTGTTTRETAARSLVSNTVDATGELPDPSSIRPLSTPIARLESNAGPKSIIWPLTVWSAATLLLISRTILVHGGLFLFRRKCRPVGDFDFLRRVEQLSHQLGMRRKVTVLESPKLRTPVAFGVVRPTLGLPISFRHDFNASEQDSILVHELAHMAGNDGFWRPFMDCVTALWWWNPLVWIARKTWINQSEMAADTASQLMPDGPARLAECLVRLGRELTSPKSAGWQGMAGSGYRSQLGKRVNRLLTYSNTAVPAKSRRTLHLTLVTALMLLLGSGLFATGVANPVFSFPNDTTGQKLNNAWSQSLVARTFTLAQTAVTSEPQPAAETSPSPVADEPGVPRQNTTESSSTIDARSVESDEAVARGSEAQVEIIPSSPPADTPGTSESPSTRSTQAAATPDPAPRLFTRSFRVEPNHFIQEMGRFIQAKRPELMATNSTAAPASAHTNAIEIAPSGPLVESKSPGDNLALLSGMNTKTMDGPAANLALLEYLGDAGVEITAPKMCYFNDRSGVILIRATLEDLEILRTAIEAINEPPPQVSIEARWLEITVDDAKALGFDWFLGGMPATDNASKSTTPNAPNAAGAFPSDTGLRSAANGSQPDAAPVQVTGILTEAQYRQVMQSLDHRVGVDLLFAPKVTTVSGRQTQIKTVEIQTVVTGVNTNAEGLFPQTSAMEFGPVLDVIPRVSADRSRIELNVVASLTRFNGYDEANPEQVVYQPDRDERAVTMQVPKPLYNVRQAGTTVSIHSGDTLVFGGMTQDAVEVTKSRVPVLGSVPLVGRLFRSENRTTVRKNLIIFITPTIVDPAGNREQAKK